MKLYNALIKKSDTGKIEDIVLLKDGFSIWAFFFSALWFLYHKMRKEFCILLVVNIAFAFSDKVCLLSGFDEFCLQMAFFFIIALNANYWLVDDLRKRGYEFVGMVFGTDDANARMRFVENLQADKILDSLDICLSQSH